MMTDHMIHGSIGTDALSLRPGKVREHAILAGTGVSAHQGFYVEAYADARPPRRREADHVSPSVAL
ncbi:hypothetical protein SGFS_066530 [Streptomyces graminofaciens]|uniref:Uncharacterized protein n=1 Tax=Streptomyces graminofaciens TaxID=68212 RepID=A0ABM7FE68_9ACTN|nr:hypothetical protein SGFS_066530 [Streptomyces graminofaciens]